MCIEAIRQMIELDSHVMKFIVNPGQDILKGGEASIHQSRSGERLLSEREDWLLPIRIL